jgi:hypothetical protein
MLEPVEFWCSVCDMRQVHPHKPETGTFYQIAGHPWDSYEAQKDKVKTKDHFECVYFAVCPDCKLEDAVNKVS